MTSQTDALPTTATPILMLIPNLSFGGAQRVFHDHGVLLGATHAVTEIVFNQDEGHAFPSSNSLLDLGVPGGGGPLAKLANFARRVRRLSAIKRRLRPAVTISHLEGADYVNVLARGPGKTLLCVHGSKLHDANISGLLGAVRLRLLVPLLYNRADRIVTVSHEIGEELAALGVRRSLIRPIHNFFDAAAIHERSMAPLSAEEQSIFDGPPVLVTSGRLTLQKNQAPLIALFAELVKRTPARLLLLGDGELRRPLVDQAKHLGLRVYDASPGSPPSADCDVYFLGFQDNPFRLQRHAQLFVLPSGWEGFPMVLGEAMACGLPIVSADCPTGPREFLAPATIGHAARPLRHAEPAEYGMLLPIPAEQDRQAIGVWVDTLDHLLGDEAARRRMARQSLTRAEDFAREKIGDQWLEVIAELTGTDPATAA
jgi:glycosyltransferase involved in cell wall biosynthesis